MLMLKPHTMQQKYSKMSHQHHELFINTQFHTTLWDKLINTVKHIQTST